MNGSSYASEVVSLSIFRIRLQRRNTWRHCYWKTPSLRSRNTWLRMDWGLLTFLNSLIETTPIALVLMNWKKVVRWESRGRYKCLGLILLRFQIFCRYKYTKKNLLSFHSCRIYNFLMQCNLCMELSSITTTQRR